MDQWGRWCPPAEPGSTTRFPIDTEDPNGRDQEREGLGQAHPHRGLPGPARWVRPKNLATQPCKTIGSATEINPINGEKNAHVGGQSYHCRHPQKDAVTASRSSRVEILALILVPSGRSTSMTRSTESNGAHTATRQILGGIPLPVHRVPSGGP